MESWPEGPKVLGVLVFFRFQPGVKGSLEEEFQRVRATRELVFKPELIHGVQHLLFHHEVQVWLCFWHA